MTPLGGTRRACALLPLTAPARPVVAEGPGPPDPGSSGSPPVLPVPRTPLLHPQPGPVPFPGALPSDRARPHQRHRQR